MTSSIHSSVRRLPTLAGHRRNDARYIFDRQKITDTEIKFLNATMSSGVNSFYFDSVLTFQDSGAVLAWISFLRDAMSARVVVSWVADSLVGLSVTDVVHLYPPRAPDETPLPVAALGSSSSSDSDVWRRDYRYGLCYYRHGPEYLAVRDMREHDQRAAFVLFESAIVSTFNKCLVPTELTTLSASERDALEILVEERLIAVADGKAVTLPYRMKHWPVPYYAV